MTRSRVRRSLAVAAAALTAVGAAAAGAAVHASSDAEPIRVGVIYSESGPLALYGEQFRAGLEAGLDYVTDGTGELDGRPLEVTFVDDGGVPDQAVSAAKELIGEGYTIIGGSVSSGVALAVAEQADQNQVLFISGPAATDAITGINGYTFRAGRQSLQDVATAATFVDVEGADVLVYAQDNAFGQGNVAAVQAVLGGLGANVSSVLVPEDATEFTPFSAQLLDAAPDMVFVAWAGATSGTMWQSLDQQGVLDSTTVVTGLGDSTTYGAFGDAGLKIDFLSHFFDGAVDNEVYAAMAERVTAAEGPIDIFTPDGFVWAQLLAQAVTAGDPADVDSMVAALEGYTFEAPKGTTTVRADDHALIQPMFQASLVRDEDGSWAAELITAVDADAVAPPLG